MCWFCKKPKRPKDMYPGTTWLRTQPNPWTLKQDQFDMLARMHPPTLREDYQVPEEPEGIVVDFDDDPEEEYPPRSD